MLSELNNSSEPVHQIDLVLADYLQAVEEGRPPNRELLMARHPELAQELQAFFANRDFMKRCAGRLRYVVPTYIGDYELLEEIGSGTFGVVVKARHRRVADLVAAIKLFRGKQGSACAEARKAALLDHPNIVPVHHVGEHEGRAYYVMKFIEGQNLAQRLQECPKQTDQVRQQRWAAELLAKIARAVHHAHQRGVIHRDLKPGNILLDTAGEPHLTDFDLAKLAAEDRWHFELGPVGESAGLFGSMVLEDGPVADTVVSEKGLIIGTAAYMSPEQAAGQELTTASDLYSLGVILYEMLTGRVPIRGATPQETLKRIQTESVPPPRSLNPRIDYRLEKICLKCLDKDPQKRYGSAQGLARSLERWLANEPIIDPPDGFAERCWLWCRRNPLPTGLLMTAAILFLFMTMMVVWVSRARAARLEEEVLKSNVYAAQGLASTVLWHLEHLSTPVIQTAEDPIVRQLLEKDDPPSRQKLQQHFLMLYRTRFDPDLGLVNARLLHGRDEPSFQAMHAANTKGILVADTVENASVLGQDFAWRDYFRGALAKKGSRGRAAVHVSRVYRSKNDGLWKFAISTPVYAGPEPDAPILGVVVANFTTSSALGSLRLNDDRRTAVLVCPKDPSTDESEPLFYKPAVQADEYLVMVHPAYHRGDKAIPVFSPLLEAVHRAAEGNEFALPDLQPSFDPKQAMDRHYQDPMATHEGRWLAGFAPVGNTEMVVVVQQRYEEAIPSDHGIIWSGAAVLLGILFIMAVASLGLQAFARPRERVE